MPHLFDLALFVIMMKKIKEKINARLKISFDRWLKRRMPAASVQKLSSKNIFIFPTKFGFIYLLFILLLFLFVKMYVFCLLLHCLSCTFVRIVSKQRKSKNTIQYKLHYLNVLGISLKIRISESLDN